MYNLSKPLNQRLFSVISTLSAAACLNGWLVVVPSQVVGAGKGGWVHTRLEVVMLIAGERLVISELSLEVVHDPSVQGREMASSQSHSRGSGSPDICSCSDGVA